MVYQTARLTNISKQVIGKGQKNAGEYVVENHGYGQHAHKVLQIYTNVLGLRKTWTKTPLFVYSTCVIKGNFAIILILGWCS